VQDYWLPTPLACFPFTFPTVRHRVPSVFNSPLHRVFSNTLQTSEDNDTLIGYTTIIPSSQFNGKYNLRYSFFLDVMQHTYIGGHIPTFRDKLSVTSPRVNSPRILMKIGQISCSTASVTYYRNELRNTPEERRSHLYCGRSPKSRKSI